MATYSINGDFAHCHFRYDSSQEITTSETYENEWLLESDYGYIFTDDTPVFTRTKDGALTSYKTVLNSSAWLLDNNKGYRVRLIVTEANTPPFTLTAKAIRDESITFRTLNITNNVGGNVSYEQKSANRFVLNLKDVETDKKVFVYYIDSSGKNANKEIPLSNGTGTVTFDTPNDNVRIDYFVIPITYSDDLHYSVDGEKPTEIKVGETFNITLSSSSGFEFNPDLTVLKITHGVSLTSKKFVLTENNTKASISYTTTSNDKKLYVQAITRKQTTPVKEINVTYDLTNCVSNITANKLTVGDIVNFTLTANDGALFKDYVPNLSYFDNYGNKTTEEFVISADKKKAVLDSFVIPNYDITIYGDAQTETTVINYGAINAYIVNVDILNAFSNKRYFKESTSGNISYDVDLGEYVNRIKRIYFPITSTLNDVIRCGNYNTGIKCTDLPKDIYEINFGDVDIPLINGDSNDFNTGDLSIFIPFVGVVSLDNSLIGKTVNLVMKINAITGNGVSILTCNGVIFDTQNVVASTDVLFTGTNSNIYKIGGDDWNEQILMGIEPYIILNYTDSINAPINNTQENVTIKDVTGFAQFENVNLNAANLLVDEYNEIVSQLETGVYL